MYEEFYGLKEKPFNLTPDPRFFFLSENHRGAFEHLLYGIKEREGFILITGEVGTGKTTLCRALLNRIDAHTTDSALILNPMFSGKELLQCILSDFGLQSGGTTKKELLDELNRFLLKQHSANRTSIVIVDEAQNLPLPVLEELRILSNLETEKDKLLQIILMGQVELKEQLSVPRLRQLNQRISIRYHLQPLARDEVPRYIQHRLAVAGSPGDVRFAAEALREIYRYSQGIPRLVNLASDRALLAGYADQTREIRRQTVIKGLKSLEGEEVPRTRWGLRRTVPLGLAGLLIFFAGIVVTAIFLSPFKSWLRKISGPELPPSSMEAAAKSPGAREAPFYTLQLGSYRKEADALEAAQRFKATGYPLFLGKMTKNDSDDAYHLYLGKFAQREDAQEVEKTFKRVEGFSGIQIVLTSAGDSQKAVP